eukprot:4199238-Pyramimonas_sp.AAC.1
MVTKIQRLQAANAMCTLSDSQLDDIAGFFLEVLALFKRILGNSKVLKELHEWVGAFFRRGFKVFTAGDFLATVGAILKEAQRQLRPRHSARGAKFKKWAQQAFIGGGSGQAH